MSEQPIPASTILSVECLVDPRAAVAAYLEQPVECIRVLSVQSEGMDKIKVRYLLMP